MTPTTDLQKLLPPKPAYLGDTLHMRCLAYLRADPVHAEGFWDNYARICSIMLWESRK